MHSDIAIIGGGPAGLMAAQVLSDAGVAVHLFDAMPSIGRKFLLAGKGGLNLTHSEEPPAFLGRYGERSGQLQPLLASGDLRYTGTATGLSLELANAGGGKVLTGLTLTAPTQSSVSGASAALSLPANVGTTPGASVAIPFHAQALVAAGPVTLTFTASGGASLAWDISPVTGLAITSGAATTVSLQGAPDLINSYLSTGKLKTGGSGSVGISGAVTASITVTQAANSSAATALPTLNLPQTFTLPTANGQITLTANALGSGSDPALHTRTVVISLSGAGSTPLTAAANSAVGLSAQTSASTFTLTGTEAALSSYLATAGNLVFNGGAGSYALDVLVEQRNGATLVAAVSVSATIVASQASAVQFGPVEVLQGLSTATLRSSMTVGAYSERGFVYAPTSISLNPVMGGSGVTKITLESSATDFATMLSGLSAGRYNARAYAIVAGDPVYSSTTTFERGLVMEFFAQQGGNDVPANLTNPPQQVLSGDPYIATQAEPMASGISKICRTWAPTTRSVSQDGSLFLPAGGTGSGLMPTTQLLSRFKPLIHPVQRLLVGTRQRAMELAYSSLQTGISLINGTLKTRGLLPSTSRPVSPTS